MSLLDNLRKIEAEGLDNFMKTESVEWACDCGGIICIHTGHCSKCKKETTIK